MKTALRYLFVFAIVVSFYALAAETYLGTVTANASTSRSNVGYSLADGGVGDAGFSIASLALLSVQCSDLAYIAIGPTSSTAATTTNGVYVSANQLLTTSAPKGASSSGAYLAVISGVTDAGTSNCRVFQRQGNE